MGGCPFTGDPTLPSAQPESRLESPRTERVDKPPCTGRWETASRRARTVQNSVLTKELYLTTMRSQAKAGERTESPGDPTHSSMSAASPRGVGASYTCCLPPKE